METILLVTWFVMGHEPSSYQVRLGSKEACNQAQQALFMEEKRLADPSGKLLPRLSVVCVPSR